jgi:oligopeptidase B
MIPIARKKTHRLSKYQTDISDDFAWLRNSDDPDVLQYLQEENQFYHTQNAHTKDCADQLYREMQQRIPTEDASVPYQDGGWWYYHTTSKNKAYRCHYRKKKQGRH